MTVADSDHPTVYTIGHSNQPAEAFLDLLRKHAIEALVDVRSAPYSRFVPQFNQRELQTAVRAQISLAGLGLSVH